MPARISQELYLCVDGGGTSVKVVIASSEGGKVLGRGAAGPCNVKTMGPTGAIAAILQATYQALAQIDGFARYEELTNTSPPPPLDHPVFNKVWLGLAGVLHQADIDDFTPFAQEAFHFGAEDQGALRITNDGHLLASSCTLMPEIESTIVLIAGTGTVGLAFKKRGVELDLVGVSGGWGYILGDEGSAYSIGRLAIRFVLEDDDRRKSLAYSRSALPPTNPLPLVHALLACFGVADAAELVHKTYSDHSTAAARSFTAAEANRKVWIAEAARVVFAHAFGDGVDEASRIAALAIVADGVQPLVKLAAGLVGDRTVINPSRSSLSLGGGLWKVPGYCELLKRGLKELGIVFADVVVVGDAPEEGARALVAQELAGKAMNGNHV
ncbi:hypothetical protein BCR35DRAFT_330682 [Leucosporidium creatinivorum]|uniref:N-acetyl-D-glucosamine kinase n=1 Tax=Leucosporidium creatinivorum TaxID=106004 RepID=A0A1Y2FPQ9_9BASI|nr:hypothetical protein BCR35DRAFT_330682 [Leucosporidium creatinivorum]